MMRLGSLLTIASAVVASMPPPQATASVVWIYDCSASHHDHLAPPPMERFGVRFRPIDDLAKMVAENKGALTDIRMLSFGHGLVLSRQWIRNPEEVLGALQCGTALNGPSPIWDAVYRAAELLQERTGRREILMATDGKSSANEHGFQEALDKSKQAGVRVNIGLPRTELWRTSRAPVTLNANRPGDPAERLKKLTEATGGRYAELSVWDLPRFFAEVAREWQK